MDPGAEHHVRAKIRLNSGDLPDPVCAQRNPTFFGLPVDAPGIEADSGQLEITMEHQSCTIGTVAEPANVSDRAPKCAIVRGVVTESSEGYELSNVVETALARALVLAAEAKRWDVVAQIAEELRRRGSAHHTSIVAKRASTRS